MSIYYVEHQRTRFWRTHEEIYDYRKYRDRNWLEYQAQARIRSQNSKDMRKYRRMKWDEERRLREENDGEFRKHREEERGNRQDDRIDNRRRDELREDQYKHQKLWEKHISQRKALRDQSSKQSDSRRRDLDKKWNEKISERRREN